MSLLFAGDSDGTTVGGVTLAGGTVPDVVAPDGVTMVVPEGVPDVVAPDGVTVVVPEGGGVVDASAYCLSSQAFMSVGFLYSANASAAVTVACIPFCF